MRYLAVAALMFHLWPISLEAGEGVVALQTAAPSCSAEGSSAIYQWCGNGTVTDTRTGLVWLANADCIGKVDWSTAMAFVAGLADMPPDSAAASDDCGLSDGSSPGEWRLPSRQEWAVMIGSAAKPPLNCSPAITNDLGTGCWGVDCSTTSCSFTNVQSFWYSSSTSLPGDLDSAWTAYLVDGVLYNNAKTTTNNVWPVRGGQ